MTRMCHSLFLLALATTLPAQQPDLFMDGWLAELLSRDVKTARIQYEKAANDETLPRTQRALALARLGELHSTHGRNSELQATYRSLAGLGIDLGIDRGEPFPPHRVQELGQLSRRFREALSRPTGKNRKEELGRLRQELGHYLDRIRAQNRTRRRAITPHPLLQRVVQHERQPHEPVENKELQGLLGRRLKALQEGNLDEARKLLQEINRQRNQLPARNFLQRMRGKRMAWITELHLRNETENARARERMLFRLEAWQERAVKQQMRRLALSSTTGTQRLQALLSVRRRVQQIAERPAISQWEREVLDELDARLAEHARNDELMEALELVARLPYRYELLQDLVPH